MRFSDYLISYYFSPPFLVSFKNAVSKSFEEVKDNISFSVEDGEFLSILGILTMISKPLFAVFVDKGNCKALSIILCSLVAIGTTIFFQSKQIGVIQSLIYIVLISMNTACIAEAL